MSESAAYVAVVVGVLAVLAVLLLVAWRGGGERRLTPLAALSHTCVVCGIAFGEKRVVGYVFFPLGILLAIADAVRRARMGHRPE